MAYASFDRQGCNAAPCLGSEARALPVWPSPRCWSYCCGIAPRVGYSFRGKSPGLRWFFSHYNSSYRYDAKRGKTTQRGKPWRLTSDGGRQYTALAYCVVIFDCATGLGARKTFGPCPLSRAATSTRYCVKASAPIPSIVAGAGAIRFCARLKPENAILSNDMNTVSNTRIRRVARHDPDLRRRVIAAP